MGDSAPQNTGQDKRTLAADIKGLLDVIGITRAVLVGHDWGGGVAQRFVLDFPDLAERLICIDILPVDVIVAVSEPTVRAAQQATRNIPIVMFGVGDPVATGIVESLGRPGGNITGLSQLSPELSGKRLELLKEVVPGVSRVAVLWNPTNPSNVPQVRDIKVVAQALGIQLQFLEVRAPQDLEGAFEAAMRGRAGALIALDDLFIFTQRIRIVALAAKSRLPAIYGWPTFAASGGLMSYGPDFQDMARRAADFVDKILKGAKPADLPVEQPTKFELVINLRTAKVLGLTIPSSLRLRAHQVIE